MWMIDVLLVINLVAVLYVWFDTNAVPEWAALFRLNFLKYKEYEQNQLAPLPFIAAQTYTEFLGYKYDQFFIIRLITCPICASVWANFLLYGFFYHNIPMIAVGPNIVATWLLYPALSKVIKKLNA